MIKRGRHAIKSHMTLEYGFTGIRIQESHLTPVDWKISIDLVATGKKGKTKEEVEYEAGIAYQKIYFWLDTNLPGIVMLDVGNEDDLYLSNLSSNITMYCPGNPGDDLIIQLLHSKVTALASPELMVGEIHLKGSDTALQYTFDCSDSEYSLPLATADYYTEHTTRDLVPWWSRDDGFCFEFIRPTDLEMTDEELFGDIVDPMDEFEKIITDATDMHIGVIREPAKIVQVEKWKPKKV
jgi:hypothetical protein